MGKIGVIIKREYLSRVKKKTFLITTILLPILFTAGSVGIGVLTASSSKEMSVAVVDQSNIFTNKLKTTKKKHFDYFEANQLDSLINNYDRKGYTALLHIKPLVNNKLDSNSVTLYSEGALGVEPLSFLSNAINATYQGKVMVDNGVSGAQVDSINNLEVNIKTVTKDDNKVSAGVASSIAGVCGFLLYMTLLIYGMMVMRGVMEEKTNRIAEVIVSSVKPFELMMGKVVGIGLVGLTQFLIWMVLIGILNVVGASLLGASAAGALDAETIDAAKKAASSPQAQSAISSLFSGLSTVNWPLIVGCFLFYFLGGYLLYASLFAAIGSLVDEDINDAQSFTMPVTLPIIISFFIAIQVVNDPSSTVAVGASLFPLTSPIVMMARLPFNPPGLGWQLPLSMALLVLSFLAAVWLSGKIYRNGILMYGKKLKWKDVFQFLSTK